MHGWDLRSLTIMYSNAGKNIAVYAMIQFRNINRKYCEVPTLYDAFTFSKAQRNYRTYKKKLCAIVALCRKYEFMFRSPLKEIIFTDHKPLSYFSYTHVSMEYTRDRSMNFGF